jgi:hypothetical protein
VANRKKERKEPVGESSAVAITPMAVSIAQTAILGGVADQVIHLLTGGARPLQPSSVRPPAPGLQESRWDGDEKGPESSAPTPTTAEDAGELSRLLKTVRERRTMPRRRPKPASS